MIKILPIFKIGIISVNAITSYIDSVILGNSIPSGIDAKVRTIYESARKNSEFFPELCFLWTKPYVFGDEKAVPEVEISIQGVGRVLSGVKMVVQGVGRVLSSVKMVIQGLGRVLSDVKVVIVGLRGVLSSMKVVIQGLRGVLSRVKMVVVGLRR